MKTNRSWSCCPYHRTLLLLFVVAPAAQVEADGWTEELRDRHVAYYNFEESEGYLIDRVNGVHYGTVTGVSYGQEGIIGSSYFFDGDDDFIQILDHDELDFNTAFSMSMWIQKEAQVDSAMLMTKSLTDEAFWIEVPGVRSVRASLYQEKTSPSQVQIETDDGVVPVDGTWLHVVLTAGSGVFSIYLNATEIVSTGYKDPIATGPHHLLIGKNLGGDINFYRGRIDEVSLWGRGLSPEEVVQLYNDGLGLPYCQANCKDNDACTDDACVDGECVNTPIECDDWDPCTIDSCDTSEGCLHVPVDCSGAGDQCNTASCDPNAADGNCDILTPVPDGTECDDGDVCTTNDFCDAGSCTGDTPQDCDDGNPCTDDSCDPASGCVNVPNVAPCDDCNICTTEDACSDGECVGGPDLDCDDGNECTTDSCNSEIGCVHEPMGCSEGRVCNPDTGECLVLCLADLNGDGVVDAFDLAVLLGSWGPCCGDGICIDDPEDDNNETCDASNPDYICEQDCGSCP